MADDAVMVDLSAYFAGARMRDGAAVVDGGSTVGSVLDAFSPADRVIPVGIVGLAGLGLVTRGGVGYLTRSVGLALDHLVKVELVLPSGEVVRLSDDSHADEADLWWAVRGCAPGFGVVTSAVMRTHVQGPVFVDRLVVSLDALTAYFTVAPQLPRHTTMGAVLGYMPGSAEEPVLLVYTACSSQRDEDIAEARAATSEVGGRAAPFFRSETRGRYLRGLPEFAIPGPNGQEPEPIRLREPGAQRGWFYGKSIFAGPTLGGEVAEGLADSIRNAPTPACRIDFQHTGGALGDVSDSATAFWGRRGEWNVPLNAIWSDERDSAACYQWARDTLQVLAVDTIGVYSVEVRPGFPETEREIELAFGGNLSRLRALRRRFDPTEVFNSYSM